MEYETRRQKAIRLKQSGMTYRQIGEELGVTSQRAQQLVKPSPVVYAKAKRRANGICQSCFQLAEQGQVHHKDLDVPDYNGLDNLLWVCGRCHTLIHVEENGWLSRHKGKISNVTGRQFGRLTAQWFAGRTKQGPTWLCSCICGELTLVCVYYLARNSTQSCGCLRRDVATEQMHKMLANRLLKTAK